MNRYDINSYLDFLKIICDETTLNKDLKHIEKLSKQVAVLAGDSEPRPKMDLLYFLTCFQSLWKRKAISEELEFKIRMFLAAMDWSEEEMDDAFFSIERHMTKPIYLEEKIVYDANYMELLSVNAKVKNKINNNPIVENRNDIDKMIHMQGNIEKVAANIKKEKEDSLQDKRFRRFKKEI